MKVFDCFTFFNEIDLLEIRLNELNDVVDYFVIIEGEHTWQNNPKPSYYLDNIDKFEKFANKIILNTVPATKFNDDAWHNERVSCNYIYDSLYSVAKSDDLIMIGSVDEIPSQQTVKDISNNYTSPCSVQMQLCYYFLNTKFSFDRGWAGTYITKHNELSNDIFKYTDHDRWSVNRIGTGWHFSFLGDYRNAFTKVHSYSHSEFNHFTEEHYKHQIDNLLDPFSRSTETNYEGKIEIDKLPIYVQRNLTKYSKYIKI